MMTKKKQVIFTVKKNWEKISAKLIDDYVKEHSVIKSFNTNATITLYILYNICYSRNK